MERMGVFSVVLGRGGGIGERVRAVDNPEGSGRCGSTVR